MEEYFRRKGQKIEFDETKLNFLLFNTVLWLTPVHEKDLVFWFGLRFHDEEVIRASEFSKSTRPRSQTRHTAQTVTPIPGNENSDA